MSNSGERSLGSSYSDISNLYPTKETNVVLSKFSKHIDWSSKLLIILTFKNVTIYISVPNWSALKGSGCGCRDCCCIYLPQARAPFPAPPPKWESATIRSPARGLWCIFFLWLMWDLAHCGQWHSWGGGPMLVKVSILSKPRGASP